jgi:Ring finger domain
MIGLSGITVYRLANLLFNSEGDEEEENELFRIKIFKRGYKIYSILLVGILYPLFVAWTLLGTVWYIEDTNSKQSCFAEEDTMNWYFLTWIISFYAAAIIFTTIIIYAGILNYRNYVFERQFTSLLEQYEGEERPQMDFNINGLSPETIIRIPIQRVSENDGQCSVCLEVFKDIDKARLMPCGHKYHLLCIDKWLMQHTSCPLCKADFNHN